MAEVRPVLIVGAGPTGMTAAMELQRMGVPVRLVDRAAGPSTTSRALALQSRTVELMAQRGLAAPMLAMGNRAHATALYADGKPLARIDLSLIPSRYNYILLLSQAETERLLREHLAARGVPVEFGTEMMAFAQSGSAAHPADGGVSATLRKPDGTLEEVEAAYLVGAEGAHSRVRETLGLKFSGKSLENSYALGDLYVDGAQPDDEITISLARSGLLAVFPMGGGRVRMIASQHEPAVSGAPEPSLAELQEAWDAASAIPARLHALQWSSRFRINSRIVERLRVGRVFLGGDSAHIHSPAGGQGMNTGMQDMVNLCWKLALVYHGAADPKLLETYETERLPVIQSVVHTTENATDLVQSRNPWVHALVTHVAPLALGTHTVQNEAARVLSQTAYSYASGPLAHYAAGAGSLHAGDRVPDAEIAPGMWLHGLLDPSRFTLLTFSPGNGDAERRFREDFGDLVAGVAAAPVPEIFGKDATYALVRPDGYLACAGSDIAVAMQWLRRWLAV